VCLSLLGSIQPGRVQEYVRGAVSGGSGDDGLLQRFGLAVWPDVSREFRYVDQWPDTPAKQAAWAVYERLAALQPASETEPVVWRFSPEAQDLFAGWMEASKTELRGSDMHPALISHLDKYSKLVPALALLFALVDTPDSDSTINEGELLRALAWADYLQAHAQRLYSAATTPETTAAAALLGKIRAGKLRDTGGLKMDAFTPRQVATKGWGSLTTPDAVRKAANLLVEYGWLASEVVRGGVAGGRPSEVFRINPAAFSGDKP
jgi:putative DNA primase/helicase